jgi:hypothetical protein
MLMVRLGVEHGRFESELYQHSDWFTNENQQEPFWWMACFSVLKELYLYKKQKQV